MKNKIVELFRLTNVTTKKIVGERLTAKTINQSRKTIEKLGLDFESNFSVKSEGMFKEFKCRYALNSMSQADIDAGGDNDPVEMEYTIYEKV